jgi:N-acetyl-anhydromuramoyl-L-alanine amidase
VAIEALEVEGGWLPLARRISSPNFDQRPAGAEVELVVIHAISLPPNEFGGGYVERLFTNQLDYSLHPYFATLEGVRVSAHFYIERGGDLLQFVATQDRAWHAGVSQWCGRRACNDFSLGIELEGCDEMPFSEHQYKTLQTLIDELRRRMPTLTRDRFVGHSDIAPRRKTDPGPCFEWSRIDAAFRP